MKFNARPAAGRVAASLDHIEHGIRRIEASAAEQIECFYDLDSNNYRAQCYLHVFE